MEHLYLRHPECLKISVNILLLKFLIPVILNEQSILSSLFISACLCSTDVTLLTIESQIDVLILWDIGAIGWENANCIIRIAALDWLGAWYRVVLRTFTFR